MLPDRRPHDEGDTGKGEVTFYVIAERVQLRRTALAGDGAEPSLLSRPMPSNQIGRHTEQPGTRASTIAVEELVPLGCDTNDVGGDVGSCIVCQTPSDSSMHVDGAAR